MSRILSILTFIAILLSAGTAGNATSIDKGLQTLDSWDHVCDDGALFMPRWGGAPEQARFAAMEYKKHPNSESWFLRACSYYATGKKEQSLESFCKTALSKHPSWAAPHYFLAKCAQQEIDDEKAIAEYKQAYELKPCWGQLLMEYVSALQKAGKYQEAVDVANAGLKYSATGDGVLWARSSFLLDKGKALLKLHKPKEAVVPLKELVNTRGRNDGVARFYAAEACLGCNEWENAIENAKIIVKLKQDNGTGHLLLARGYAGLGKDDLALKESAICLKLSGEISANSPMAHKLRATIYQKQGKKDLAAAELKHLPQNEQALLDAMPFRMTTGAKQ